MLHRSKVRSSTTCPCKVRVRSCFRFDRPGFQTLGEIAWPGPEVSAPGLADCHRWCLVRHCSGLVCASSGPDCCVRSYRHIRVYLSVAILAQDGWGCFTRLDSWVDCRFSFGVIQQKVVTNRPWNRSPGLILVDVCIVFSSRSRWEPSGAHIWPKTGPKSTNIEIQISVSLLESHLIKLSTV